MHYARITKLVQSLNVRNNTSYRGDCPACGGRNSFSATKTSGCTQYYCFRASCKIKGKINSNLSLADAKSVFRKTKVIEDKLEIRELLGWDREVQEHPKVVEYLTENNCMDAYHLCPDKFWYDTIKDRVCFTEYNGVNDFKLATGRSLRAEKPKWYKYIALPGALFSIRARMTRDTGKLYIAEDCASACSLSRLGYSFALCGTSYEIDSLIRTTEATGKQDVVICLDKDAAMIAMKLKRDLEGAGKFKSVKVAQLSDDAKYLKFEHLVRDLENI